MTSNVQSIQDICNDKDIYQFFPANDPFFYHLDFVKVKDDVVLIDTINITEYPKFKNLNAEYLKQIRLAIHYQSKTEQVHEISLKILKFCELNMYGIYKKMPVKFNDAEKALFTHELISLFLDYYLTFKDLRYFNTALKLWDKLSNRTTKAYPLNKENSMCLRNLYLMDTILNSI